MSAQPLPERPDLDQLKRQAKELLHAWKTGAAEGSAPANREPRLRDAQRAIAHEYGFESWDALRAHVDAGGAGASRRPARVLDYDDPIPDVIELNEPLTEDVAKRLADAGVAAVRIGRTVAPGQLEHLARIPSLQRIDFGAHPDFLDGHVAFMERMPWLTAVSFARCGSLTDAAVGYLRTHQRLQRINLLWTNTGDDAIAALAGKSQLSRLLVGARLTDAGASRLREFPALVAPGAPDAYVSLSSARSLTDEALTSIAMLQGVIALDVHMSAFGSPSYTARGVSQLRHMASLEELNFHGALASDAVLQEIAWIPKLRALHCQDPVSGDEGFTALGACSSLEHLGCRVCARLTDRGFAAIASLPRLTSLGLGGPRVSDDALAHLAGARRLVDLGPIMFGDAAFAHIARIPRLERLTNMYNRSTTDAATRYLHDHQTLVHYSAFGTQITDDSLRVLAGCQRLETLEFENCAGITDAGLREVLRLPRLRRVSAWACIHVNGEWVSSAPPRVEAKFEESLANQLEGYRAETLLDYPDLAVPVDAAEPAGPSPGHGVLSRLLNFGLQAEFVPDGLRLSSPPGADTRWIAAVTRDAFAVPLRLEMVVRPLASLRIVFGAHNRSIALDHQGSVADPAPWFMKSPAQRGEAVGESPPTISPDDWATVVVEIDTAERRLFVNGVLRHIWRDDFSGIRGRIGIGVLRSELVIRNLTVDLG